MPFEITRNTIMEVAKTGEYGFVSYASRHTSLVKLTMKDGKQSTFLDDDLRFPMLDLWAVTEIGGEKIYYDSIHTNSVSAVDGALSRKGNKRYEIRHFVYGEWVDITYIVIEGKVFQVVPFEWIPA